MCYNLLIISIMKGGDCSEQIARLGMWQHQDVNRC